MFRHHRVVAGAIVLAAWVGAFGAVGGANADDTETPAPPVTPQTDDQRFAAAVAELKIPPSPEEDLPAVGHKVCDWLTSGLAKDAVNPIPTVRGVVSTLQKAGISKGQAVGVMRASVGIYCPQYTPFMGR